MDFEVFDLGFWDVGIDFGVSGWIFWFGAWI
jgi:hypothetical protein